MSLTYQNDMNNMSAILQNVSYAFPTMTCLGIKKNQEISNFHFKNIEFYYE